MYMYENNFIVDAKIEIIIKSDVVEIPPQQSARAPHEGGKKEVKKRAKKIIKIKQKKELKLTTYRPFS